MAGANVNALDEEGLTPLDYALRNNNKEMAKWLLLQGGTTKDEPSETLAAFISEMDDEFAFLVDVMRHSEQRLREFFNDTRFEAITHEQRERLCSNLEDSSKECLRHGETWMLLNVLCKLAATILIKTRLTKPCSSDCSRVPTDL